MTHEKTYRDGDGSICGNGTLWPSITPRSSLNLRNRKLGIFPQIKGLSHYFPIKYFQKNPPQIHWREAQECRRHFLPYLINENHPCYSKICTKVEKTKKEEPFFIQYKLDIVKVLVNKINETKYSAETRNAVNKQNVVRIQI